MEKRHSNKAQNLREYKFKQRKQMKHFYPFSRDSYGEGGHDIKELDLCNYLTENLNRAMAPYREAELIIEEKTRPKRIKP